MIQSFFKKSFSYIIICIALSILTIPASYAYADQTEEEIPHVYDKAGLLSTSEIEDLENMCIKYGEDAGIELMILTHNDPNAVHAEDYIEEFEDQMSVADRVYVLIDMNEGKVYMEGYGLAETYINSERIDAITEEMIPCLQDEDYYNAFVIYIKRSAEYMKDDSVLNYDHDYSAHTPQSDNPNAEYYDETWPSEYNSSNNTVKNTLSNVWLQLIAAIAIGAITVAIMAYHSGGKMTAGGNTYMDHSHSGLIGRRDDYIRTSVTRVRKPQNNNNNKGGGGFSAGGFRGGISSGGRSHSSGGRNF